MDKEHVKGAMDKAKGAVKDTAGKVLDDKEMQAEARWIKPRVRRAKQWVMLKTPQRSN